MSSGRWTIAVVASLLDAMSTWFFLPWPVVALHDCPSDNQIIAQADTNGRGVGVGGDNPGMAVRNNQVNCARASSIGDVNASSTRFVELGWYEEPSGINPCPDTSGPPRILVAKYINGVYTCDNQPEISGTPRDDDFRVHDDNQDGDWRYFRNGTFLGFYGLGTFVTGAPVANAERKSVHSDPTMYGNFRGLDRMNSSQNWVSWSNPFQVEDSDPDFRLCIRSDTHVEMQDSPC